MVTFICSTRTIRLRNKPNNVYVGSIRSLRTRTHVRTHAYTRVHAYTSRTDAPAARSWIYLCIRWRSVGLRAPRVGPRRNPGTPRSRRRAYCVRICNAIVRYRGRVGTTRRVRYICSGPRRTDRPANRSSPGVRA